MLILDTDHLSAIDQGRAHAANLMARLEASGSEVAATVISAEEQFRGWLAQIHRQPDPHFQIDTYRRFQRRIDFYSRWRVMPWNEAAADVLLDLQRQRVRIGTMDLKIASIAISHDAMLLSRNLRDFRKVLGLNVENWLD